MLCTPTRTAAAFKESTPTRSAAAAAVVRQGEDSLAC